MELGNNLLKSMKSFAILFASFILFTTTGCSEDNNYIDLVPVTVDITIADGNGVNLLAEDGPLYEKNITMTYNGVVYDAAWNPSLFPGSRATLAFFHGLIYVPESDNTVAHLNFGDLDANCGEVDLLLTMPDGSTHNIHIARYVREDGKDVNVKQAVSLDGVPVDGIGTDPHIPLTIIYNN